MFISGQLIEPFVMGSSVGVIESRSVLCSKDITEFFELDDVLSEQQVLSAKRQKFFSRRDAGPLQILSPHSIVHLHLNCF